ncbi:oxygen-insensitive NADPH nitroreductase [Paenalkalicoccus suaedae]|uniref:Oxygen-insensitive NADPH nitroreductase n=1 Tax=Paenalkalicoccus suaedae TaxID=2592382 RepID=A0A859FGT0_9BACI|nr:oxygen-insensitive NADPH nitroreductase [Paenalkalicoccus suaedae]QKS72339.1 oxygen-insensitive NADPH nitroreductase [Paenalkalicoccus suaedae]
MRGDVLTTMQAHRSVRHFTEDVVSDSLLMEIIAAARCAPSSHHLQAYSMIHVTDPSKKRVLRKLCGDQRYVEEAPVFLVFILDYYKHFRLAETYATDFAIHEVENLLVGAVDTALVAQNTLLAAQSKGLGGVMIGGIRNEAEQVAKLLELPSWTVPIMGMCLGYPSKQHCQKPRLPAGGSLHHDRYQFEQLDSALKDYEETTRTYYQTRESNRKDHGWGYQTAHYLKQPRRESLTGFIQSQGFRLR